MSYWAFGRLGGALAVTATCLTGCASLVDGTATRVPGTITADGVELELLNTGNYPTAPLPPFGNAGTPRLGANAEAARLAAFVVLPTEVEPALVNGMTRGTSMPDADAVDTLLPVPSSLEPNPMVEIARANGFVTGYSSTRSLTETGPDRLGLENAVLVFPDDAAAKTAATEMAVAYPPTWPDIPTTPMPIPDHPDALAFGDDFGSGPQVKSFTPLGRYVLYQRAGAATGEAAAQLIAATLAQQIPLIDQFTPTDPAKLVDLPRDPTGVLARTLPDENYLDTGSGRAFEGAAWLHNTDDPLASEQLYADVGLVGVGLSDLSVVYQATDDDAGSVLRDGQIRIYEEDPEMQPAAAIPGMPNVDCLTDTNPIDPTLDRTVCVGAAGKYAFVIISSQAAAAHQMAAAQYLMLTAP